MQLSTVCIAEVMLSCRSQGISPEEKAHVRTSLLAVVAQEDSKVSCRLPLACWSAKSTAETALCRSLRPRWL